MPKFGSLSQVDAVAQLPEELHSSPPKVPVVVRVSREARNAYGWTPYHVAMKYEENGSTADALSGGGRFGADPGTRSVRILGREMVLRVARGASDNAACFPRVSLIGSIDELAPDVNMPSDIPWCRIAHRKLSLGSHGSTPAPHFDTAHSVHVQLEGGKRFLWSSPEDYRKLRSACRDGIRVVTALAPGTPDGVRIPGLAGTAPWESDCEDIESLLNLARVLPEAGETSAAAGLVAAVAGAARSAGAGGWSEADREPARRWGAVDDRALTGRDIPAVLSHRARA
ncbi:hypothetical protein AB0I10_04725, partial [Streptomyces sp. NPDC050636]|uniref:hypothetical protein n=1 Tax=Streptomyces sp. NPDC050636 TaxID=3154510 RepID=UPI00342F066B